MPKKTIIGTVDASGIGITGIIGRVNTAKVSLISTATDVATLFNVIKNNLNTNVDSITNPVTGLVAGLNCRLFGEGAVRITDTLCSSLFNTFYLSRLIMGIASYGILFAICCIVCSGVRHYKLG